MTLNTEFQPVDYMLQLYKYMVFRVSYIDAKTRVYQGITG